MTNHKASVSYVALFLSILPCCQSVFMGYRTEICVAIRKSSMINKEAIMSTVYDYFNGVLVQSMKRNHVIIFHSINARIWTQSVFLYTRIAYCNYP